MNYFANERKKPSNTFFRTTSLPCRFTTGSLKRPTHLVLDRNRTPKTPFHRLFRPNLLLAPLPGSIRVASGVSPSRAPWGLTKAATSLGADVLAPKARSEAVALEMTWEPASAVLPQCRSGLESWLVQREGKMKANMAKAKKCFQKKMASIGTLRESARPRRPLTLASESR